MSSNSEFPVSSHSPEEEVPQILHTGSSQLPPSMRENIPDGAQPIEEGISAPDTVWDGMRELPPTTQERPIIDQATAAQRDSFNAKTAPKEKSAWEKLRKRLAIGAGIGTTALAGALVIASVAAGEKDPAENTQVRHPLPETTNSAPAKPGPVETETVKIIETKFFDENGNEQSVEQVSDAARLTTDKYLDPVAAFEGYLENVEKMINHRLTPEEVRNNLGYANDKELTRADYQAAAKVYRKAHDSMYTSPSGTLYSSIDQLGNSAAGYAFDTKDEPDTYELYFEMSKNGSKVLVSDNSLKNSVKDDPLTHEFTMFNSSPPEQSFEAGKKTAWEIPGDIDFKHVTK